MSASSTLSKSSEPAGRTLALDGDGHILLRLAGQLHHLKQLPRRGWEVRGVHQVESVAAHSLGVGIWCLWLADRYEQRHKESVNRATLLSLALLHDLAEASMGDLIPLQKRLLFGEDPAKQAQRICEAEERFWQELKHSDKRDQLTLQTQASVEHWVALWREYREGATLEARLVKQADMLDCVMQAISYRWIESIPLAEFAQLIQKAASDDPELVAFLEELWQHSEESMQRNR